MLPLLLIVKEERQKKIMPPFVTTCIPRTSASSIARANAAALPVLPLRRFFLPPLDEPRPLALENSSKCSSNGRHLGESGMSMRRGYYGSVGIDAPVFKVLTLVGEMRLQLSA